MSRGAHHLPPFPGPFDDDNDGGGLLVPPTLFAPLKRTLEGLVGCANHLVAALLLWAVVFGQSVALLVEVTTFLESVYDLTTAVATHVVSRFLRATNTISSALVAGVVTDVVSPFWVKF